MYDPQRLKHLTDALLSTKTSLNVLRFTALTVQQQTLQQLNIQIQLYHKLLHVDDCFLHKAIHFKNLKCGVHVIWTTLMVSYWDQFLFVF